MSEPTSTLTGTTIVQDTEVPVAEPNGLLYPPTVAVAEPLPVRSVTATADLTQEFVSASGFMYAPWLGSTQLGGAYLQQLPNPVDELTMAFGSRLYDRDMPRDPQIYSLTAILTMALLCQGLDLTPPVPQSDPLYEQGAKMALMASYCLDNLNQPLSQIMYEMTIGMIKMGHKVGEQIYAEESLPDFGLPNALVLSDIKPKEHDATAFVVDGYRNKVGMLYLRPGHMLPQLSSLVPLSSFLGSDQAQRLSGNIIPMRKFWIPVHNPENGDPRGTSILASVYTAWWKKLQLTPQEMAYVARFAQPSVWANIGKDAKETPVYDTSGGVKNWTSIVDSTTKALVKIKGGAVASFINTQLGMLEAHSDGKVIFDSFDHQNREMAKGILMQTLTTEESRHMARAAGAIHQDVFGIMVAHYRENLAQSFRRQVLYPLMEYNYGEKLAKKLTPIVSLGSVAAEDRAKVMSAIAQVALAGGIHDSQWPAIWEQLELPPADMVQYQADIELRRQQQQQMMDAQKLAAKAAITAPAKDGGVGNNDKNKASDGPGTGTTSGSGSSSK